MFNLFSNKAFKEYEELESLTKYQPPKIGRSKNHNKKRTRGRNFVFIPKNSKLLSKHEVNARNMWHKVVYVGLIGGPMYMEKSQKKFNRDVRY